MDTAEDFAALLDAVPDDPTMAVRAYRRERVNRALKAIKGVLLASDDHLERLVILVFANFAFSHTKSSGVGSFAAVSIDSANANCSASATWPSSLQLVFGK